MALSDKGRKIRKILIDEFKEIKRQPVASVHLLPIIRAISKDNNDLKSASDFEKIRDIEERVRNIAAHEIVSVTEEWIEKMTGMKPDKIMSLIKRLFLCAGIGVKTDYWSSYENMNKIIIDSM